MEGLTEMGEKPEPRTWRRVHAKDECPTSSDCVTTRLLAFFLQQPFQELVVAQLEEASSVACPRFQVLGWGFLQVNKALHPCGVGKLAPDLSEKDETLSPSCHHKSPQYALDPNESLKNPGSTKCRYQNHLKTGP